MNQLQKLIPQPTPEFAQALQMFHTRIPDYTLNKLRNFTNYKDEGNFMEVIKNELKINNSKPTPLKYGEIKNATNVEIEDGSIYVQCNPSPRPQKHEFNTGLVFYVPQNHVLIIHADHDVRYTCNPVVIDSVTRTNIMLYIDTVALKESMRIKFHLDLFYTSSKFTYNGENYAIKNGKSINNFKNCITGYNFEVTDTGVTSPEVDISISKNSALAIFNRKREHRIQKFPMMGMYYKKDGSVVHSKFNEGEGDKTISPCSIALGNLSFAVLGKYISNITLAKVEVAPSSAHPTNGGFNGWFDIYDENYDVKVKLFKEAHKLYHWEAKLGKMLKSFGISIEGDEDVMRKLRSVINTKRIKQFQSNLLNYKEFKTIDEVVDIFNSYDVGYFQSYEEKLKQAGEELNKFTSICNFNDTDSSEAEEFSGDENKENKLTESTPDLLCYEEDATTLNEEELLTANVSLDDEEVDETINRFRFPLKRAREEIAKMNKIKAEEEEACYKVDESSDTKKAKTSE